jgi:hypothetical protein
MAISVVKRLNILISLQRRILGPKRKEKLEK